jgi:hypothetical protein
MVQTPQWVKGAIAEESEGRIHRLPKAISKPQLTMPHKSEAKSERYCGGMENITSKLSICKNASPSLTDSRSERYNPHRRTSLGQASAKPPQKHVFRFESV